MGKVHDLEKISFTMEAYKKWLAFCPVGVKEWKKQTKLERVNKEDIPGEQFRELPNGDGEIFVTMPDGIEIKMLVPKGHWGWQIVNEN